MQGRIIYNIFWHQTRENFNFGGHPSVVLDSELGEFAVWVEDQGFVALNEAEIRVFNDLIFDDLKEIKEHNFSSFAGAFSETPHKYPFQQKFISHNFFLGDRVLDLYQNKVFTVQNFHDLSVLRKDSYYQLVDRQFEIPLMSKAEVLKYLNEVDIFKNWELIAGDEAKSIFLQYNLLGEYEVDSQHWKFYKSQYKFTRESYLIVTPENKIYRCYSNISRPFYDAFELITGQVFWEYDRNSNPQHYYLKKVREITGTSSGTNSGWKWSIARNETIHLFEEEKSFRYNNFYAKQGFKYFGAEK